GRRWVEAVNSYTEVSPSGGGVKIFIRGTKPGKDCRKPYADGEVEIYDHARFFTVTGQRLDGISTDVEERQEALDALYAEVFGKPVVTPSPPAGMSSETPSLSDDEIINLAGSKRRKERGDKFVALYAGRWNDYFNSASEADASVCFTLAYYTKDAAQIDRLFRRSGLMRDKWDESRGDATYGDATIANALAHVTQQYRPRKRPKRAAPPPPPNHMPIPPGEDFPPLYRADVVVEVFLAANDQIFWRSVFYLYAGTHYRELTDSELTARIAKYVNSFELWARPAKKHKDGWEMDAVLHPVHKVHVVPERVVATNHQVREIMLQLKTDFLTDLTETPSWLDAEEHPHADEIVACTNGLLHLPTRVVHPHTQQFFSLNAVDYAYTPSAAAPSAWLEFLHDLFDDDVEAVETLQELFGYYLLPDTRQHKIGLIVGPKRGGKGTIARVLTGVLGRANVCGPTLGSLGMNFGLWPLLHKRLAIISDARLSGRTDQAVVVERLLSISGEDAITVDRKHLPPWTGKLPTRFLILTNELPKLTDASGALASRFILLCLTRSWYGREDHELTDRLLEELPGILNWSIAGWQRLNERGHFVQPASAAEALQDLEDLSSPIRAFVRERCEVGPGLCVDVEALFAAWQDYCGNTGRERTGTIQSFGRDLRAACPGLRIVQPRVSGRRARMYEGVALRPEADTGALARGGTRVLPLHA
ncbi:MAG: phage/plasmid primase, P4 family, partial [Anaerolineae bacterium]|nr:phage/plasmid primase, P4 family [Anaerolineae bacterium]